MVGELEDAIVARINLGQTNVLWPYKLMTIETYGGQIAEDTQSVFRFPAVFVAFTGSRLLKRMGERTRLMQFSVTLYVAARNPRNERATRHGDMHEAGSYQIAEDMIALLENQSLGLPMQEPLIHTGIETLFVARKSDGAKAESILAVPFECQFIWESALPESANATLDDWLQSGQNFYLNPADAASATTTPDLSAELDFTTVAATSGTPSNS
jgi:phage gp37-like protein